MIFDSLECEHPDIPEASKLTTLYSYQIWPQKQSMDGLPPDGGDKLKQSLLSDQTPKVLNVEQFPMYWGAKYDFDEKEKARSTHRALLDLAHRVAPGIRVGTYGMVAGLPSSFDSWHRDDVEHAIYALQYSRGEDGRFVSHGAVDASDFLVQPGYVRYHTDDPDWNRRRIREALDLLLGMNKRIYVYVWHRISGTESLLPLETWKAVLDEVQAKGAHPVLWSRKDESWSNVEPYIKAITT
jgi:hypothetical protein